MKIYLACGEIHNLKQIKTILLSYYDVFLSSIPFRKETFKELTKDKK